MGNCIEVRKPTSWVDEEDASVEPRADEAEDNLQADSDRKETGSGSGGRSAEIKIKMSKRQAEELLQRVDSGRISLRQALGVSLAISGGESTWEMVGSRRQAEGGHWRPKLQGIPEEDE